jgi:hypothetical protein
MDKCFSKRTAMPDGSYTSEISAKEIESFISDLISEVEKAIGGDIPLSFGPNPGYEDGFRTRKAQFEDNLNNPKQ